MKCSSMMGFNISTKVTFVSLPKKFPSRQEKLIQFGSKLSDLMFHVSLSESCFKFLWHCVVQYIGKRNFSQIFQNNIIFEQYGPHLAQNHTAHIKFSKDFYEHTGMMKCNSYTLVILVNLPRKFLFGARGNLSTNYATLFS